MKIRQILIEYPELKHLQSIKEVIYEKNIIN